MQFDRLKRREFITLLGGAATWPIAARGQQSSIPVIGFINGSSATAYAAYVQAFIRGLAETGHTVGENVAIEYRWAEGHYDRIPDMVDDLVPAGLPYSLRTRRQHTLQSAPLATSRLSSLPARIQSRAASSQA
jgi:putative ABC transport system substrate-binding protein